MENKFKQLVESTVVEVAPIVARSAVAALAKKSAKTSSGNHEKRDWLVNKAQGAAQRGTSNRITSGNVTTNHTSQFNKERKEQINYTNTQQGIKNTKDDDSHNELVTQTSSSGSKDQNVSKVQANRFKARVTRNVKASDKSTSPSPSTDTSDTGDSKKSVSKLASVKSASRGVLGAIVSNL